MGVAMLCKAKQSLYCRYFKRLLDIVFSAMALIILSPLLLTIAVLIKRHYGSPVIFKQERPGLDGKIFTLYKFRTMTDRCDRRGRLLPDKIRITRFGRFLRNNSLDELPELINILKGEMSLVGPRPLLVQYLSLYNDFERRRHEVKPGLSGLAQVSGRNALSWSEKFRYDVYYVDNLSLMGDLRIIMITVKKLLLRKWLNQSEIKCMEIFTGTKRRDDNGK